MSIPSSSGLFIRRLLPKLTPITLKYPKKPWYEPTLPGKAVKMTVAEDVHAPEGDVVLIKAGTAAHVVLTPKKQPEVPSPGHFSLWKKGQPHAPTLVNVTSLHAKAPHGCTTAVDGSRVPITLVPQGNPFEEITWPGAMTLPGKRKPPLLPNEEARLLEKAFSDHIEMEGHVARDTRVEVPQWLDWASSVFNHVSWKKPGR